MITAYHHVEINGVKYRLAEDAEGNHYRQFRQPLRLQSGAVVQGESGKFQLRKDLLEWRISSWSGGEGQIKFDQEEPNRYWEGHNVDPLAEIGKLKLARGWEETNDALDATIAHSFQLTTGLGGLWGASPNSNQVNEWDETNKRWKSGVVNPDGDFVGGAWQEKTITGDSNKLYIKEKGDATIWSFDGTNFVAYAEMPDGTNRILVDLESRFYAANSSSDTAGVHEIPKSGTPPVSLTHILDLSDSGAGSLHNFLAAGTNRIYLAQVHSDSSVLWRITPSTAASTGFGEELLRQEGLRIESVWVHMGVVFLAGRVGLTGDDRTRVIMYLRGSEVGVLANIRNGTDSAGFITSTQAQEFEKAYFLAKYGPGDGTAEWTLFAADLISGAIVGTTVIDIGDTSAQPQTLVAHNGEQFFGTSAGGSTNERTIRVLDDGTYVDTSSVTARLDSSIHDFGIVDPKILLSVRLSTEPLPANSSVEIQYQLDGEGTWTSAGAYSTTDGTGTEFVISTDTAVKTFRTLQLRLILSNGGVTTETPVVLSVSVRATVSAGLKLWDLLLDVSDDTGEASGERTLGTEKISNIETAGDSDTVVSYKDGYHSRKVGEFDDHDVVMDDYSLDLGRPQEGTALVRLRQVT